MNRNFMLKEYYSTGSVHLLYPDADNATDAFARALERYEEMDSLQLVELYGNAGYPHKIRRVLIATIHNPK